MTSHKNFHERNRDAQDGIERHVFGKLTYLDKAGAVVTVNGTGTQDQEAIVLNTGYGMNFEDNEDVEVFLVSSGSDRSQKFALVSIPRDKQRKWGKGRGGVQNPLDPDKAVELNEKRVHATDPNFAVGAGLLEVIDGKVYLRADLHVSGTIYSGGSMQAGGNVSTAASFIGPDPSGSGPVPPPIPGFDP